MRLLASFDATTSPGSELTEPSAQQAQAFLQVVFSPDAARVGERISIGHDALVRIGREQQEGGLWLADARMSRLHARVLYDRRCDALRIGDAESRNGTFVNGLRVESAVLSAGDVIRVGDTLLVYDTLDVMAVLDLEMRAAARLDATVLIRGETGTGKELVARALHAHSARAGAFVPVNCGSVPIELLAAELFGHTKQAFSGATQARKGLFADAAGGTLFLDEIGDCPMPIQVALLRALQEKAVRPVGSEREVPVDVRVVAATHGKLEAAIEAGTFRADLFARLSQIQLELPPLRARRGQILALLHELAVERGLGCTLHADVAEALLCYGFPLNVRELQALLNACVVRGVLPGTLTLDQLHAVSAKIAEPLIARRVQSMGSPERSVSIAPEAPSPRGQLRSLLEAHGGNVSAVAQELGKPRAQVYRWLKSMGVSASKFRK